MLTLEKVVTVITGVVVAKFFGVMSYNGKSSQGRYVFLCVMTL